jgi:hypothetical protein
MAVRAKRKVSGPGRLSYETSAADLLNEKHPLHSQLRKFAKSDEPTKRQARRFLQRFPMYRESLPK